MGAHARDGGRDSRDRRIQLRGADARRGAAARRRVSPRGGRAGAGGARPHALRSRVRADIAGDPRPRADRRGRDRARLDGRARPARLRRRVSPVPRRARRRLRLGRVGRRAGVVQRRRGDGRTLLCGGDAVAGGRRAAAAPARDRPDRDRQQLLRRVGLPGRRVSARLQPLLGADHGRARQDARGSRSSTATSRWRAPRWPQTARAGASTASGSNTPCSTTTGAHCRSTAATARSACRSSTSAAGTTSSSAARSRTSCGCAAKGAASSPVRGPGWWSGRGRTAARMAPIRTTPSRRSRRKRTSTCSPRNWSSSASSCSNGSPLTRPLASRPTPLAVPPPTPLAVPPANLPRPRRRCGSS